MGYVPVKLSERKHVWRDDDQCYVRADQQHWAWRCDRCGMTVVETIYGDLWIMRNGYREQVFAGVPPCPPPPTLGLDTASDRVTRLRTLEVDNAVDAVPIAGEGRG